MIRRYFGGRVAEFHSAVGQAVWIDETANYYNKPMKKKEDAEYTAPQDSGEKIIALAITKFGSDAELAKLLSDSGAVKVNLPEFVKPDSMPIGSIIFGVVREQIGDFTGNPDMADSQNLIIIPAVKDDSGAWVLRSDPVMFPVTGQIGQSLIRFGDDVANKGIAIKRKADGWSKKNDKKMFEFDVFRIPALDNMLPAK